MTLLDIIRSALGLGSSDDQSDGKSSRNRSGGASGTDVSVEHDPDGTADTEPEPDVKSEAAVKGVDTGTEDADDGVDEPVAAGTDADGSTASITEEPPEAPDADADEVATEPAEAAGAVTDHAGTDHEAAEPAEAAGPVPDEEAVDEAADDEDAAAEDATEVAEDGADEPDESAGAAEPAEDDGPATDGPTVDESVDTISGIGPAYATRLGDAGVETVGDLVEADATALASDTGISEKRIGRWIEAAQED